MKAIELIKIIHKFKYLNYESLPIFIICIYQESNYIGMGYLIDYIDIFLFYYFIIIFLCEQKIWNLSNIRKYKIHFFGNKFIKYCN